MIALLVTIDIQPEFKERFMEELLLDAKGANDEEPGCLRFDVIQDSEDPNRVHLYAKPYSRTLGTNVYPSDENWR